MVETTGEGMRIKGMVDTLPSKYTLAACIVALTYLVVMLIVGAAGPATHTRWTTYSFTCNGSWNYKWENGCEGNDMSQQDVKQKIYIPAQDDGDYQLSRENFEFSLIVWPYNSKYKEMAGSLRTTLDVKSKLYGSNNKDLSNKHEIFEREERIELLCSHNRADCYGFYLFLERTIDYPYYEVQVEFLDSPGKIYVEQVKWESNTQNLNFNDLQLGFRYTYFAVALILTVVWVIPLRSLPPALWPFEQRSVFLLLIGLLFLNNPFFALHLTANSWFWTFLDGAFQIFFCCLLFFFWFGTLGRIRYAYTGTGPQRMWIFYSKIGAVASYGVCALTTAYWLDVKFNRSSALVGFGGVITFYYFALFLMGSCLVWVMLGGILHIPPAVTAHPHQKVTYLFLAFPAALVSFSMMIGVFAGMYGAEYNSSSVLFMYYFGMFNVYVYLLVFGFFPSVADLGRGYEVDAEAMKLNEESILIGNSGYDSESNTLSSESAARALGAL
mmetsp:Transcript_38101/g.60278  ORF Transcript_38101/g.60278 Transcript_38101/m.60278 type:complete len:497 (-) Transcript_38101:57-1547(-)